MAYCTRQNLIDRYGEEELIQLTDRANIGQIDDAVLDQAIADAAAEIDGYLSARYTLPLGSVPAALTRVAADIARYDLYSSVAPEHVRQRYEDARRFLEQIAAGRVQLGAGGVEPPSTSSLADIQSGGRVFGRDSR